MRYYKYSKQKFSGEDYHQVIKVEELAGGRCQVYELYNDSRRWHPTVIWGGMPHESFSWIEISEAEAFVEIL